MLNEDHTYNLSVNDTLKNFCTELTSTNGSATASFGLRQEWENWCHTRTNGNGEGLLDVKFAGLEMEKDVLCIVRTRLDMKPCEPKLGPG